jgi:hypothetical protein
MQYLVTAFLSVLRLGGEVPTVLGLLEKLTSSLVQVRLVLLIGHNTDVLNPLTCGGKQMAEVSKLNNLEHHMPSSKPCKM